LAPLSKPTPNDTDKTRVERKKREEDELICRGHIVNSLFDHLYDLYINNTSANEIWESLETKYKADEEGTKKFIIFKYFDFKFSDSLHLLGQVHELQIDK